MVDKSIEMMIQQVLIPETKNLVVSNKKTTSNKTNNLNCPYCNRKYKHDNKPRQKHIEKCNRNIHQIFHCNKCLKTYTSQKRFNNHKPKCLVLKDPEIKRLLKSAEQIAEEECYLEDSDAKLEELDQPEPTKKGPTDLEAYLLRGAQSQGDLNYPDFDEPKFEFDPKYQIKQTTVLHSGYEYVPNPWEIAENECELNGLKCEYVLVDDEKVVEACTQCGHIKCDVVFQNEFVHNPYLMKHGYEASNYHQELIGYLEGTDKLGNEIWVDKGMAFQIYEELTNTTNWFDIYDAYRKHLCPVNWWLNAASILNLPIPIITKLHKIKIAAVLDYVKSELVSLPFWYIVYKVLEGDKINHDLRGIPLKCKPSTLLKSDGIWLHIAPKLGLKFVRTYPITIEIDLEYLILQWTGEEGQVDFGHKWGMAWVKDQSNLKVDTNLILDKRLQSQFKIMNLEIPAFNSKDYMYENNELDPIESGIKELVETQGGCQVPEGFDEFDF